MDPPSTPPNQAPGNDNNGGMTADTVDQQHNPRRATRTGNRAGGLDLGGAARPRLTAALRLTNEALDMTRGGTVTEKALGNKLLDAQLEIAHVLLEFQKQPRHRGGGVEQDEIDKNQTGY